MKKLYILCAAFCFTLISAGANAAANPMTASCASSANKTAIVFACCMIPETKKTKQFIVWLGPYGDTTACSDIKTGFVSSKTCNSNTTQVYLLFGEPDESVSLIGYALKTKTICTVTS